MCMLDKHDVVFASSINAQLCFQFLGFRAWAGYKV